MRQTRSVTKKKNLLEEASQKKLKINGGQGIEGNQPRGTNPTTITTGRLTQLKLNFKTTGTGAEGSKTKAVNMRKGDTPDKSGHETPPKNPQPKKKAPAEEPKKKICRCRR